jgi:hypothetical protein
LDSWGTMGSGYKIKELLDGGGVEGGSVVGPNVGDGESRMELMVALELWKG